MAKPRKVEEPAAAYSVAPKRKKKPSASASVTNEVRYLDTTSATNLADKIFSERKNLLHKLAQ